jgi:tRNA A37 methylthiotransferase MiaB
MKRAIILIDRIGCSRNMMLYRRLVAYLEANSWLVEPAENPEFCQLVLFCSCGFTLEEQRKNLKILENLHARLDRIPPATRPMTIVTGCLPGICPDSLAEIHPGAVVGITDLNLLDTIIQATVPLESIPLYSGFTEASKATMTVTGMNPAISRRILRGFIAGISDLRKWWLQRFSKALYVTLADSLLFNHYRDRIGGSSWCVITSSGCLGKCSYCAIRFAKGSIRSRPRQAILGDIREGVRQHYRLISLVADDNGSYGRDIGTDFVSLVKEASGLDGEFQLLIDSLSPAHFIELVESIRMSTAPMKIRSIQLGLQHVSSRILAEMNRPVDSRKLKECLSWLAVNQRGIQVFAILIVGWPGETRREFRELVDFLRWFLSLNPAHFFASIPYSPVPGTEAAKLPGRHSPRTIARRGRMMSWLRLKHELLNHARMARRQKNPLKALAINSGFRGLAVVSELCESLDCRLADDHR